MAYWRYRAFDDKLQMREGVLVGPAGDSDSVMSAILLRLRNQGLQGVAITQVTREEYIRETKLTKLKERLSAPTFRTIPAPRST